MKFRCKPGIQAIVIRSACGNHGREVSVVRLVLPGEVVRMPNGLLVDFKNVRWLVESRQPLRNDVMDRLGYQPSRLAFFADGDLLPISPPPPFSLETARNEATA